MRFLPMCLIGLLVSPLPGLVAQESGGASVEERLLRLEKEVQALRKENEELRRTLGIEGRAGQTVVKPAGKEPTLQIGGLLQVQAETGDKGDARYADDNDRIYLRRARLNASGRFLEELDFRLEVELSGTLASTSALRAQLTDGYITWNRFPFLYVRAGQLKTPFGYEQLYADPRLLTEERTLVNDRLTLGRQVGVQLAGDLLERRISYAVGVFGGNGVNSSFNDNSRFLTVGRVSGTPWQGRLAGRDATVTAGVDAFSTRDLNLAQASEFGLDSTPATPAADGLFTGEREGFGVDVQLQWGGLEIWAELLRARFQPDDRIPLPTLGSSGWYVQAGLFLVPNRLQGVVRYDAFDPNRDRARDETRTFTLGLNYLLKGHDLKLQLDYVDSDVAGAPKRQGKWLARVQTIF